MRPSVLVGGVLGDDGGVGARTALATQMSFGAAAEQMQEQHGHELNRTLVERRTYAVGQDAVEYLTCLLYTSPSPRD